MDRTFFEKTGNLLHHCQQVSVKALEKVRKVKIPSDHEEVCQKTRFLALAEHIDEKTKSLAKALQAMKTKENFFNYQDGKPKYFAVFNFLPFLIFCRF